jgi:cell division protein FtsI/penicillin-binding protein 2
MKTLKLKDISNSQFDRSSLLKLGLIIIGILLIGRVFYIQIIRHDYYQAQALEEHMKKFEIAPSRGQILMQDGNNFIPVVLNEKRYLIFADPFYVEDAKKTAEQLISVIGGDTEELTKKLENKSLRYVIVAKKAEKAQADKIKELELVGVGMKKVEVRTYPQGSLAAQVLGFVNDEGKGQYGLEEYLNDEIAGKPGLEKAITDVNGTPLALNNDTVIEQATPGDDVYTTLDVGMQKIAEDAIERGVKRKDGKRGSVIIMEANSGAVKAIANYPTYDPAKFSEVKDGSVFLNTATNQAWEPGSVMKPIIMSASFNEGATNTGTTYYDSMSVKVDDRVINNSFPWGAQTMTMQDVIAKSLNTGAVFLLKSLGAGELNQAAREKYHAYLTERFRLGQTTGIEQAGEGIGVIPDPNEGYGLNVVYSNMSFGQGMTLTPIQLVAAYAALVNGGTYYKPSLVMTGKNSSGEHTFEAKKLSEGVISKTTSQEIRTILKKSLETNNPAAVRAGYSLGAKSGTAEIADGSGSYKKNVYNGVYVGYLGGNTPKYIMLVRIDEPITAEYASSEAAQTWAEISNAILDNYPITQAKN